MRLRDAQHPGFTLTELLIVIAILGILSSTIFIALNPTRQLGNARDRKRHNDLQSIMDAVHQYEIDMNQLPVGIPMGTAREICKTGAASCVNGVDLSMLTQSGKYLVFIPEDPHAPATGTGTRYLIYQGAHRRLTVVAPLAEQAVLSVSQ